MSRYDERLPGGLSLCFTLCDWVFAPPCMSKNGVCRDPGPLQGTFHSQVYTWLLGAVWV